MIITQSKPFYKRLAASADNIRGRAASDDTVIKTRDIFDELRPRSESSPGKGVALVRSNSISDSSDGGGDDGGGGGGGGGDAAENGDHKGEKNQQHGTSGKVRILGGWLLLQCLLLCPDWGEI